MSVAASRLCFPGADRNPGAHAPGYEDVGPSGLRYRNPCNPLPIKVLSAARGAVAQLGERSVRNAEVEGSIPFGSTKQEEFELAVGQAAFLFFLRKLYSRPLFDSGVLRNVAMLLTRSGIRKLITQRPITSEPPFGHSRESRHEVINIVVDHHLRLAVMKAM